MEVLRKLKNMRSERHLALLALGARSKRRLALLALGTRSKRRLALLALGARSKCRFVLLALGTRSRRRLALLGLGALLLGLTVASLIPILSGRTSPPAYRRESAFRAFAQAEKHDALHWVPREHAAAKKLLDQGAFEYRRQAARFLPLRNFTDARQILAQSEQRSWDAANAALAAHSLAQERARKMLQQASEFVTIGRDFSILIPLSVYERTLLTRAQLSLDEAKVRYADGEYAVGLALAAEAESVASRVGAACSERAGRYADTSLVERWRRMVDETVAWSRRTGQAAIVVSKAAHSLTLYSNGVPRSRVRADIGRNSVADKTAAGDLATPEGKYRIVAKKDVGQSRYHRALLLDYPTPEDLEIFRRLRRSGKIRAREPGGQIEIHGEGGRSRDWTRGCVAIANPEMDALFRAVDVGTPVVIVGSHGDGGPFVELVERFRAAQSGVVP